MRKVWNMFYSRFTYWHILQARSSSNPICSDHTLALWHPVCSGIVPMRHRIAYSQKRSDIRKVDNPRTKGRFVNAARATWIFKMHMQEPAAAVEYGEHFYNIIPKGLKFWTTFARFWDFFTHKVNFVVRLRSSKFSFFHYWILQSCRFSYSAYIPRILRNCFIPLCEIWRALA